MVSVADAPFASVPTVHTWVPPLYVVPALGVVTTLVKPAGTLSVTATFVAVAGPLFVIVTV